MILTSKEIEQLSRKGVKLTGANGEPIRIKHPEKEKPEPNYLRMIAGLLEQLVRKPDPPTPIIKSPDVIVKPPDVTVTTPPMIPPTPVRKWHFKLKKNMHGETTEITAIAQD